MPVKCLRAAMNSSRAPRSGCSSGGSSPSSPAAGSSPSRSMIQMLSPPERSDVNAIHLPSGRKARLHVPRDTGRQRPRLTARDRHRVDVAEKVEDDLLPVRRDVERHPRAGRQVERDGVVVGIRRVRHVPLRLLFLLLLRRIFRRRRQRPCRSEASAAAGRRAAARRAEPGRRRDGSSSGAVLSVGGGRHCTGGREGARRSRVRL